MNKLPIAKRTQIVQLLVEGMSLRTTSRVADVSVNTVTKLVVDVGSACQRFHDATVVNLNSQNVKCGEIWSFVHAKNENVKAAVVAPSTAGDVWTWTGIDADTKLIVSWYVGNRDAESAHAFMLDVKSRLRSRVHLNSDGCRHYLKAVKDVIEEDIDFSQLVKIYGASDTTGNEKRCDAAGFTDTKKNIEEGRPDEHHISTSFVERQNLTTRMHRHHFTQLTNPFSRKVENHCHAIALHLVYYNFCKVHNTLHVTPAMEAKLAICPMTIQQMVELTDKK